MFLWYSGSVSHLAPHLKSATFGLPGVCLAPEVGYFH